MKRNKVNKPQHPLGVDTPVAGESATWQFVAGVVGEMLPRVGNALGYVEELRRQEREADAVEMERLGLLFRTSRNLQALHRTLRCLGSLARYSTLGTLDCPDRIIVNRLCRMLVQSGEIKAEFESGLPDSFTLRTNEAALAELIQTLVLQGSARLLRREDGSGDHRLLLCVAPRKVRGEDRLVFIVEDNGGRMAPGDIGRAFTLPDELPTARHELLDRMELRLCWQIVRLLGGSIRIDPDFSDGRRVIFTVGCVRDSGTEGPGNAFNTNII